MSRYDLTRAELGRLFDGEPAYRVDQVWDGMYRRFLELDEVSELPRALRERLGASGALAPAFLLADEAVSDRGLTVKWLLEAADGTRVETVLMGYRDRVTVCVSSQAGCAMACGFCATGQGGFFRQLSTGEIVEQVVRAARRTAEQGWGRLGNIVLMGMGEPLANYANVRAAIGRWNTDLGIGARSITVSTVGIVPGIRKLAADPIQVNLAVSLHAANDELRSDLVPINRRYPLGALMEACRDYVYATRRRISFEWACIAGVNDRPSDARELAELARPLGAHVNLIPLNPTPGYLVAGSTRRAVVAFRDEIAAAGVNVTIRNTRGRDVNGACGQLAGSALAATGRPRVLSING
ncbi:MAG: 23S rRNA (adenine(2503)-C(2))-methyltransferase RlmN [Acidimicrobiales bacterium]|jgi:23S rRNA (adenine2503-C2)-methyltransferase